MVWGAIAQVAGSLIGKYADRQETRHNNKQQYVYNAWLQDDNQKFQKYMAENAHQLEMKDLQEAGLNPALTAMSSTASSIAGKSSPQGTSSGSTANNFGNSAAQIVDSINNLRRTNADIDKTTAETANVKANTLATIEMLPLSKKEKEALIKFTNERARGITNSSSYSGNFGNKLIGGGGSYSNTTVR